MLPPAAFPSGWASPRAPAYRARIIEYYYKNDALGDPMVAEEHITAFGWAAPADMDDMVALTLRINDFLTGLFLGVGITLVDFKVEFGRLWENEDMRIVLADEISPDNCRLWDSKTNEKMDKDRFRRDMGQASRRPIRRSPSGWASCRRRGCATSRGRRRSSRSRGMTISTFDAVTFRREFVLLPSPFGRGRGRGAPACGFGAGSPLPRPLPQGEGGRKT